jgi:uncharacterized protein
MMKVVVDVNHPAQVHCFKNFIREMEGRGHEVLITATKKDVSLKLLDAYGFRYLNLGTYGKNVVQKLINIPIIDVKMYLAVKDFDPDIFVGLGSIRAAHVSFLMRKRCVNLEDTESSKEQIMLYLPFVDTVCTPSYFKDDLGKKQVRFDACKELAYLHPNYFKPDPSVLDTLNLTKDERFIILRLVSWGASHDIGQRGIGNKVELVKELEKFGRVLVSVEGSVEKGLEKYVFTIPPEKFHDLLHYATLYIGEGGTTASESALLGTHAIFVSTIAKHCGVFNELHSSGLLWACESDAECLGLAKSLLANPNLKNDGKEKLKKLLSEKIDLTSFLVWFVENYPESIDKMKSDPLIQNSFKKDVTCHV